ncbi:MAG: hypothetical protein ACRC4W_00185 [Treponemataceae bacterium]
MKIKLNITEKKNAQQRNGFDSAYYDSIGFWGVVKEVHPESNTVHVRMRNGEILTKVRVASFEWVTVDKKKGFLSGERHLPPVDTFVFCITPNKNNLDAFVLCSGFSLQESVHDDFKKKGDDGANVWEKVENSGWKTTTDYRTGTKIIQNKKEDGSIKIEVDQESENDEKLKITIHENEITITKDGIDIKTKKSINIKTEKDQEIKAQNITIESSGKTEIKGSSIVIGGTVTPKGTGALCAIPVCPFSGAPHTGDTSMGGSKHGNE